MAIARRRCWLSNTTTPRSSRLHDFEDVRSKDEVTNRRRFSTMTTSRIPRALPITLSLLDTITLCYHSSYMGRTGVAKGKQWRQQGEVSMQEDRKIEWSGRWRRAEGHRDQGVIESYGQVDALGSLHEWSENEVNEVERLKIIVDNAKENDVSPSWCLLHFCTHFDYKLTNAHELEQIREGKSTCLFKHGSRLVCQSERRWNFGQVRRNPSRWWGVSENFTDGLRFIHAEIQSTQAKMARYLCSRFRPSDPARSVLHALLLRLTKRWIESRSSLCS